jgi:hypothetical protein
MSKILNLILGVIAAGIGFVILYPILEVTSSSRRACSSVFSLTSTRVTAH